MIIGVTGNSGAGKTTVAEILARLIDGEVINADKIVKNEQQIGRPYYKKIVECFGEDILQKDLQIDREKFANIIFEKEEQRLKLNEITHKYIVPIIIYKARKNKKKTCNTRRAITIRKQFGLCL